MRAHLLRKGLPLGVLVILAVGASACDVSPPAATVNGTSISENQLNAALTTVINTPDVQCALEIEGETLPRITGVGESTVGASFASGELSTLIEQTLVAQDVADHNLHVTPADRAAASADVSEELTSSQAGTSCPTTGSELLADLPRPFAEEQVTFEADIEQLVVALGHVDIKTPALRASYLANASEFTELCVSQLVTSSQADAQTDRAQIEAGTSFADEAESQSLDTSSAANGGAVGCFLPDQIGSDLATTLEGQAIGQVSQPLSETASDGSAVWVLLEVTSRPLLPFSEASPIIRQQLLSAQSAVIQKEIKRLFRQADVTTDPQYGRWSRSRGVTSPIPPPAKFVLSPSADETSLAAGGLGGLGTTG